MLRNEGVENVEGGVGALSISKLMAQVQGLQQIVETLVRAMANQGIHKEDPFTVRDGRHRER